MKTKFFRLKSLFAITVLQAALPLRGLAADKFVVFQSAADAWQLKEQTVDLSRKMSPGAIAPAGLFSFRGGLFIY